jgi:hypothetical protein
MSPISIEQQTNYMDESERVKYALNEIKDIRKDILRLLPHETPRYARKGRSTILKLLIDEQLDYIQEVCRSLPNMDTADQEEVVTLPGSLVKLTEACNNLIVDTWEKHFELKTKIILTTEELNREPEAEAKRKSQIEEKIRELSDITKLSPNDPPFNEIRAMAATQKEAVNKRLVALNSQYDEFEKEIEGMCDCL